MAKYGKSLAEVKVYINGKEQAKKDLEELRKVAKGFSDEMENARKAKLAASNDLANARERANATPQGSAEHTKAVEDMLDAQTRFDEAQKNFKVNETEWKKYQKLIKETEKMEVDLETALQHLSEQDIVTLNKLKRSVEAVRNKVKGQEDPDKEFLNQLNDALNQIVETIKNKKGEIIEFSDVMNDLTNIDDTSLAKVEQRLRSLIASTDKDDVERLKQLNAELDKAVGERQRRVAVQAVDVQQQVKAGTWKGTIEETQKAIELQKQYQKQLDTTDAEGLKDVQKTIEELNKSLSEGQRKYVEEQAKATQTQIESGTYKGTIEETEKAIELQRQYMKLLDDTDAAGIKKVEDTIEELQNRLAKAKNEMLSYNDAMKQAGKIADGTWKGTMQDLDKIKKSLEYHKKNKLELGDEDSLENLKEIEKALSNVDKAAKGANMSMADIEKLLKDLDSASVEDLEKAAKNLQDALHDATRGTEEYAKTAAKLREVNQELKKAKKEWEGQENVIAKTAKRLMAYVAVYGGFNEIIGKMKEVVQLNLQLSDSLADVQKTTGLTGVELQELGRSLERIDTRTATTELYNLAAAAGQIGLKTQEDVLGFAKAANTISVALNELGAEGSAALMKIATLTGEVERYGTEDALMKVGSAINELTANSAATAGPIADFISRVGGIASASKMAISEMAALGAAADASGQSIEIAGTSMNKLISALMSNTENIAYAANISLAELQGLIDQGETMQAVIRVFESMQNMDRGATGELLKELGSEGARMNQYVASMVANLDLLKRQLNISREAFDENISVINEYNVKQESAMGILQRMKNAFMDTFVNSKMTVILKDVLEFIADIPAKLEKIPGLLVTIKVIIAQILLFKLPFLLHNLMLQLSGLYKLLSGPVISAFKGFHAAVLNTKADAFATGRSINYLTAAFKVLGNTIAKHPIMFIAGILTAGIVVWNHYRNKIDEVTKAMAELDEKHSRQIEELNALRAALESTNASYATRAAAMREINSLYSKYLGFEINELDVYGKKAKALDYINAKLRENQALEQENRQREVYSEGFAKESKDELETIRKVFQEIPEITAARVPEAMEVMNEAIKKGAKDYTEILKALSDYFQSNKIPHYSEFFDNKEDFNEYIRLYTQYQTDLANVEKGFSNLRTQLQSKSNQELWELNKEQFERIQSLTKSHEDKIARLRSEGAEISKDEQVEYLRTMLKEQEEYLKTSEMLFEAAKQQDLTNIKNSRGANDMFDIESLRKNVSEATAVRAEGMNKLKEQQAELKQLQEQADKEVKLNEAKLVEARLKENNEVEIQTITDALEEQKKLRDDYGRDIQKLEAEWQSEWVNLQTKNASEVKLQWLEVVQTTKNAIKEIQMAIEGDPFGKLLNLKSWKGFEEIINPQALKETNASSIVNVYKKLREDYLKMSGDLKGLNEMFDFKVPMTSLDQAQKQIFSWAEQLRNELRRRGLTTTGMMIAPDAKSQVDDALNKLKTHFIKRQTEIRQAFINGSISSAEMNRRIAANDEELLKARVELRKRLMNEASYFNQALYPELKDVDLKRITDAVGVADTEIRTALKEGLEEDKNTITEEAIKIREAIEKELMAGDPFATLRDSFRSSLDELELLSSEFERDLASSLQSTYASLDDVDSPFRISGLDEEAQRERLDFLIGLSEKSYTIDRDGLREMFASHKEYYNWVTNLDDDQMDVMLAKLQWFYDESLIKQANYRDRILKGLESSYLQQEEKMSDVAKLEWKIAEARSERNNLQAQNDAYDQSPLVSRISQKTYDSNIEKIESYNQAIKKLEEDLLDAREKAANKSKSFRGKKERETKEQMEASISALQAYYNEMEAMIRKQGLENSWTPEDIERKVLANRIAAERDEIELRKKLLGDASTFDPNANNGYRGVITGTEFFGAKKGEAQLKKQAEQIQVWGKALIDGMRNQIAKGEIEIATDLQKVQDKIKDALLEGNMFGKFENDFASMLNELGVLTTDFEDQMEAWQLEVKNRTGVDFGLSLSEEERAKRIAELTRFADESYSLTAESLRERMMQNTMYANWVENLNDDEMNVLLQKLRTYYDDRIELTKKYQDKMTKEFEAMYKQTGQQAEYEQRKNDISQRSQQQSDLEGFGVSRYVDYDAKRQGVADNWENENKRLEDEIAAYQEKKDALTKDLAETMRLKGMGSPEYQELYQQYMATSQLITDTEVKQNELLAQSQRDLTQVYMDEWTKRAERWGQWGEMFGEYLGEQVMLEKQANDARARGDLETAKKIEQQQKQNKQNLIKNLLSMIVDEAALWAKEYALKMMFNALMSAEDKKRAIEEVSLEGKKTTIGILLNALLGQSKEHSKGLPGLVTGAIIFAATMVLQAFAKSAISNMFPEAASGSTSNRKLSTGMLTYAEGNYPVLGNDGKVYDAKYEGSNLKTGVYGGGAHFGIFSEKQPEMIVDGKTTQKLILNYPYIYDAITTIAKNGRLVNAIPTFAAGDYPAGMQRIAQVETVSAQGAASEDMIQMRATMEETKEVNRQLLKLLQGGITAHLDGLENYKQQKKNERFLKRRGID